MQLDPTRWLVSLAGFMFDWIITREWSRAVLYCLPGFFLAVLAVTAAASSWRDSNRLAQWYLELGNEEIADWEQAWAPTVEAAPATAAEDVPAAEAAEPSNTAEQAQATTAADGSTAAAADDDSQKVSRFAETLFRRAQALVSSERSQFVIAATLAQRGAVAEARVKLAQVAPDDRAGYAPAHALMSQILLMELQQQPQADSDQLRGKLLHHIMEASRWDRCPRSVLLAGSDINLISGNMRQALALLADSAQRYPEDSFALAQRAQLAQDQRLFDQAWPRAERYLRSELNENPKNQTARLQLAQIYAMADQQLDKSEAVLMEVSEAERTPEILRALSQVYVMRYRQSLSQVNGKITVNLKYLDTAMRIDPANPYVAEEIAKLARMEGPNPSLEMIEHLKSRLAEGTATSVTHACLAELRLLRKELDKAIPHLEQVINRLPNSAEYLNNLAYCLAENDPARYTEALGYATRAIAESKRQPNADYYDTLAHVLDRMDRHKEAITAIETAIELTPKRIDFHQRASGLYQKTGDSSMAQVHQQVIKRLEIEEAERIEAERLAAERKAAEEKLAAEKLEAERLRVEKLEELRYAAEQAMAAIAAEVATEAPAPEAPVTEAPATEAPATEAAAPEAAAPEVKGAEAAVGDSQAADQPLTEKAPVAL